jgi:hypothetical protein
MVSSWTTNRKATTAGSLLVFEDNVSEDGLSSQSTYKVNIDCPYYKALSKNTEWIKTIKGTAGKVYGGMMTAVNELRLQIASKKNLSSIDRQGKSLKTNIAKVQAQNVVFWPLDNIELVDWTTTNKFSRLWFCEESTTNLFSN